MIHAIAYGLLACVIAFGGGTLFGIDMGRDMQKAEESRVLEFGQKVKADAADGAASAIAKIEVKNVTRQQTLEREVRVEPRYVDCKHTPDGLRSLNAILTDSDGSGSTGGGQLPGADPAK